MASVKIPAWPKGVAGNVWANELADQSLYVVESDLLSYTAAAAQVIFSIPEDSIIWSIGLEVVTAFTGTAGANQLLVTDTGANLAAFGIGALLDTAANFVVLPVLKRYTKNATSAAGVVARPIRWTRPPGSTAGTARVWLQIKPNQSSLRRIDASL